MIAIGATAAAWIATAYWGPAKLDGQLVETAQEELRNVESEVRKKDPNARTATEEFGTKLPIVKVALLRCPAPFVFYAETEVRILPDIGEKVVARYLYTPWRVYQRAVEDRRSIVPRISDPAWAFTNREGPNKSPEPTPTAVTPPANGRKNE